MNDLTEKWKAGELELGKKYWCKTSKGDLDIFEFHVENKGTPEEWWCLIGRYYVYNKAFHLNMIKVLAEVPTYEELQSLESDRLAKKEGEEIIAELENENKKLKSQLAEHKDYCCCAKNEVLVLENARLKELLKKCDNAFEKIQQNYGYDDSVIEISEPVQFKIREALK